MGLNDRFSELLLKYNLREDLVEPFRLQLQRFFQFNHQDLINSIKVLEKEIANSDLKLKDLAERFWLSSVHLPSEQYKFYQDQIMQEKADK